MARSAGMPSNSSATPRSNCQEHLNSSRGHKEDNGERYRRNGAPTSSQGTPVGSEANYLREAGSTVNKAQHDHRHNDRTVQCNDHRHNDRTDGESLSSVQTQVYGRIKLGKEDKKSRATSPSRCHAAGCICEMCNCGQHHCPLKKKLPPRLTTPFTSKSGYRDEYREYGLDEKVQNPSTHVKGRSTLWDTSGNTGQSRYKTDYLRYPEKDLRPTTPQKKPPPRHTVPFEGISAYRADYTEKQAGRQGKMMPPKDQWAPGGKFNDVTTNRADFDTKQLPVYQPRPRSLKTGPALPFEGSSEYRDRYLQHQVSRAVPERSGHQGRGLWDVTNEPVYTTSYRDAHTEKPLAPAVRRSHVTYKPNNQPTGTSTNRAAYISHPVQRAGSVPASKRDTQPWKRGDRTNYTTENQATIGEAGRCVTNCPAAVLTAKYSVVEPPTNRSHIYFDDKAKCWY